MNRFIEQYEDSKTFQEIDNLLMQEIVSTVVGGARGYLSADRAAKKKKGTNHYNIGGSVKTGSNIGAAIGAVTGGIRGAAAGLTSGTHGSVGGALAKAAVAGVGGAAAGALGGALVGGAEGGIAHAAGYTVGAVANYFKKKFGRDASKEELADKLDKLKKRGVKIDDGASISSGDSSSSSRSGTTEEHAKGMKMTFGHWRKRRSQGA